MARTFFVGGNWKCNGTGEQVDALCGQLRAAAADHAGTEVVVAPPFVYVPRAVELLRGVADVSVAGQNCGAEGTGAFTGEVAPEMLRDVGCAWVILGHSERRSLYGEGDALVGAKTARALGAGLGVIFCIGESLQERERGETEAVLRRQLAGADLPAAGAAEHWARIVIAYEPVWAIGTGKVASPQMAEDAHVAVRAWLAAERSQQLADATRVIYGGSVGAKNCAELAKMPNIDGFLVGGASLKPEFAQITSANH